MGKAPKYSGPLATPIDLRKLLLEGDLFEVVRKEIFKKFGALIDHYQIDRTLPAEQLFFDLACRLAFHHVPGFRVINSQRRGAKPKWTLDECLALVDAVNVHKRGKGLKVALAAAIKQPGWRWTRN